MGAPTFSRSAPWPCRFPVSLRGVEKLRAMMFADTKRIPPDLVGGNTKEAVVSAPAQ